MTIKDVLEANGNDLTDYDLAVLADWAGDQKFKFRVSHPELQRPFGLLREGADLLIRRRATAKEKSSGGQDNQNLQP